MGENGEEVFVEVHEESGRLAGDLGLRVSGTVQTDGRCREGWGKGES